MKINAPFAEIISGIRKKSLEERSHSRSVINWEENHHLRQGEGKAIVFILPTRGCSWALSRSGGCSICGYIYDNPTETDYDMILNSIKEKLKEKIKPGNIYSVKLFSSGSFLDPKEIPLEIQGKILEEISQYKEVCEVVLESRPEYVTVRALDNIKKFIDIKLVEIAIGLESANNEILNKSINKGFMWEDFKKAAKRIEENGGKTKAYLLFKPPFVSEYDSIKDIYQSTKKLVKIGIDSISINAISIHRGTYLAQLFDNNQYRTPWIWSLIHICKIIKTEFPELRIICDVVSGGNLRGAHNCGKCDKELLKLLSEFSIKQDVSILKKEKSCECKINWKGSLLAEKINLMSQKTRIEYL